MLIWILMAAIAVLSGAVLLRSMASGAVEGTEAATAAEKDLAVYRAQLAEVERDLARGVIGEADAGRLRTEISRRILDADRARRAGVATGAGAVAGGKGGVAPAAILVVAAALAASLGLYRMLGAPAQPDAPIARRIAEAEAVRANRPDQAAAEADALAAGALPARAAPDPDYLALVEKLRAAVGERPDDLKGQELLMRQEAGLGNFPAAAVAQARVVALKGAAAGADDYAALAELRVMAAAGYVSPEAETALTAALVRDPRHGTARYYLGLLEAQIGRPDRAFRLWRDLLEEGPETAPWVAPIRDQIDLLAAAAGARYQPPPAAEPALAGPGTEDVEAAAGMSAEDREVMIRGMVDRLGSRLAEQGGSAAEWARLINALAVLGETGRARSIYTEARASFAGQDAALAEIAAAAAAAGVAE